MYGRSNFRLPMALGIVIATFVVTPALAEDTGSTESPAAVGAEATKKPIGPGGPSGRSKPAGADKSAAPSGIQLARKAPLSAGVNVHDKVVEECQLETMLPQLISEKNPDVRLVDKAAGGTQLELRIVDVHAPNGGFFSGPKWITVEGKLVSGKTVKGNFTVKETSMASATACGMLAKVMTVMAGDIAEWLHAPTKDARLGHAR